MRIRLVVEEGCPFCPEAKKLAEKLKREGWDIKIEEFDENKHFGIQYVPAWLVETGQGEPCVLYGAPDSLDALKKGLRMCAKKQA